MLPDQQTAQLLRRLADGMAMGPDDSGQFRIGGRTGARIGAVRAARLVSAGLLVRSAEGLRATAEAAAWLRRHAAGESGFQCQHGPSAATPEGARRNLAESPLSRLAIAGNGEAFLQPHHVEAGERIRALFERAQMQPRLTMSYDPTRTATGGRTSKAEVSEMAADARRKLSRIVERLPADCAGVVIDVCALLKGLQVVEAERGWPRRSAKLVLRIGLDQVAAVLGLGATALGPAASPQRTWLDDDARPTQFG